MELNDIIDAILFKCAETRGYYQDIGVLADSVAGRVRMEIPTVQGFLDLLLQFGIADLGHPVEVRQFHIEIVDNLGLGRTLGKENGSAAAERLGVDPMLRDEREDMLQHGLLPP